MYKSRVIFCLAFLMLGAVSAWSDSTEDLLRQLQAQVSDLQRQVSMQNEEITLLKEKVAEQDEALRNQHRVAALEETLPRVVGNMSIGGGLTGIIQGTSGNDDNTPPQPRTGRSRLFKFRFFCADQGHQTVLLNVSGSLSHPALRLGPRYRALRSLSLVRQPTRYRYSHSLTTCPATHI